MCAYFDNLSFHIWELHISYLGVIVIVAVVIVIRSIIYTNTVHVHAIQNNKCVYFPNCSQTETRVPFSRRPTSRLPIESQTLTI